MEDRCLERLSWDEYFGEIARVTSLRSSCLRAKCGAVVVVDNRIVSTGYNGSPPGELHCIDIGCLMEDGHCQRSIHAEVNAIAQCPRLLKDAVIYTYKNNTGSVGFGPCRECMKVIKAAGITRIVNLEG